MEVVMADVTFSMDADMAKAVQGYVALIQKQKEAAGGAEKVGREGAKAGDSTLKSLEAMSRGYHKAIALMGMATEALRRQAQTERESADMQMKNLQASKDYVFTGAPSGIGARQKEIDALSAAAHVPAGEAAKALSRMRGMPEASRRQAIAGLPADVQYSDEPLSRLAEIRAAGDEAGLSQKAVENLRLTEGSDKTMSLLRILSQARGKLGRGARGKPAGNLADILAKQGQLRPEDAAAIAQAETPGLDIQGQITGTAVPGGYKESEEVRKAKADADRAKAESANLLAQKTVEEHQRAMYQAFGNNVITNTQQGALAAVPASVQDFVYRHGLRVGFNIGNLIQGKFSEMAWNPPGPRVEVSPGAPTGAAQPRSIDGQR
jgi:hypothetical protein